MISNIRRRSRHCSTVTGAAWGKLEPPALCTDGVSLHLPVADAGLLWVLSPVTVLEGLGGTDTRMAALRGLHTDWQHRRGQCLPVSESARPGLGRTVPTAGVVLLNVPAVQGLTASRLCVLHRQNKLLQGPGEPIEHDCGQTWLERWDQTTTRCTNTSNRQEWFRAQSLKVLLIWLQVLFSSNDALSSTFPCISILSSPIVILSCYPLISFH
jgi:hypothetical protein